MWCVIKSKRNKAFTILYVYQIFAEIIFNIDSYSTMYRNCFCRITKQFFIFGVAECAKLLSKIKIISYTLFTKGVSFTFSAFPSKYNRLFMFHHTTLRVSSLSGFIEKVSY